MHFIPHMELYPNYEDGLFDNYDGTQKIATNSFLKDGNILYLMGGRFFANIISVTARIRDF